MALLIPFAIAFAFGFFVSMVLFNRRKADGENWEAKYRELNGRYRELTRRLNDADTG